MALQPTQPTQQNHLLNLFNYNNKQLRTFVDKNHNIHFSGKDSASILEYVNTRQAINKHVDDEDKTTFKNLLAQIGKEYRNDTPQNIDDNAIVINESGLYSLIFSSKKDEAKAFRRWITSKVIPSIRKTGSYSINNTELTPQQQLQKQHLDNESKKLDLERLKLCKQVMDNSDTPQNKRYFEQYLLNSVSNNNNNTTVNNNNNNNNSITYIDPESYMDEGVTQLAVENNIVTGYIAQKYGSPCGRYVAKKFREKYPNDEIKQGKKIWCANNSYISPNTYKHKYKNEIIGWIREYFDTLNQKTDTTVDNNKSAKCKPISYFANMK